jgi:ABC-2 type transport system ATP-binding protein
MTKLGKKQLLLDLRAPLERVPAELASEPLELAQAGNQLVYTYDARGEQTGIPTLLRRLADSGIEIRDLQTKQSSLEEIFVNLLRARS